jgi:hypothetical protein
MEHLMEKPLGSRSVRFMARDAIQPLPGSVEMSFGKAFRCEIMTAATKGALGGHQKVVLIGHMGSMALKTHALSDWTVGVVFLQALLEVLVARKTKVLRLA